MMQKKWLKVCVLNALILMSGIVVLELIFGNWIKHNPFLMLNIPTNVEKVYRLKSAHQHWPDSVYKRDEWGLRGAYKSLSGIDMITVGGSTTEQRMLPLEMTWQEVLKQHFWEAGREQEIVNAGISGQSSIGHIKNFEWWFPYIPELRSKYVLVYIGINDMFISVSEKVIPDPADTSEIPTFESGFNSVRQAIVANSALYFLWRLLQGYWQARELSLINIDLDFTKAQWVSTSNIQPSQFSYYRKLYKYPIQGYAQRLKVLIERIRHFGAHPIIVTQARGDYFTKDDMIYGLKNIPAKGIKNVIRRYDKSESIPEEFTGIDHYIVLSLFNKTTMAVCGEAEAICLDLGKEVEFEVGDFYDYVHTTPSGSKKIGDYLYSRLCHLL